MFNIDGVLNFSSENADSLYLDAGKIKRNYEMLSNDLNKITDLDHEDFVKIYLGLSGGHIRPVIASTKMLSDFISNQYAIAAEIGNKAESMFTGEADDINEQYYNNTND